MRRDQEAAKAKADARALKDAEEQKKLDLERARQQKIYDDA